jgi:Protein of unknown function (DUF1549)/Protein of unknown function (DUF1553)
MVICVWFISLLLIAPMLEAEPAPLDFDTQVAPVFTRFGCNSGACHGSAAGRGGFKLSLYGSNPALDYEAIALQLQHRRVNLSAPGSSLVVMKPTGQFDHEGDVRFDEDSPAANRLVQWIRDGAVRAGKRSLTSLTITTDRDIVDKPGESVQLGAVAEFSDGTTTDVTDWTVFAPDDLASVQVNDMGQAKVLRRGRHIVIARFLSEVQPVELILPADTAAIEQTAATQPIDLFVDERLRVLRYPASKICTDEAFVRRVWLDLGGRLPTPTEVSDFVSATSDGRRAELIDVILASPEFAEFWTLRLTKLLRVADLRDHEAGSAFRSWLHSCVETGVPWDQIVNQLVTAEGAIHAPGPAAFFVVGSGPRGQSEYLSEALLGIRLRCANCHDHPLDRWTQDDYHGLSAIIAGVQTGASIGFNSRGTVIHPGTGLPAVPRIPGERFLESGSDLRPLLSEWMTSESNPWMAVAMVNRVWSWLLGRGLVEPVDDLRVTNPATHPRLLQFLASDFAAHKYDLRYLIKSICLSTSYQRASEAAPGSENDRQFYSHALRRPLSPEVLLDAICDVTGVEEQDADGLAIGRVISQVDPGFESMALATLGRCEPGIACTTPETTAGLSGILALINGPVLNAKLQNPSGRVAALVNRNAKPAEIVRSLYQVAYGRCPDDQESRIWTAALEVAEDRKQRIAVTEDFVWSLLASEEFRTNH